MSCNRANGEKFDDALGGAADAEVLVLMGRKVYLTRELVLILGT